MIDRERVEIHLAALDGYLRKLRHFASLSLDELLGSWERVDAFERAYEVALQSMLDVGSHLLASYGEAAAEYRAIPAGLVRLGVISPSLGAALAEGAGMRNLLAHRYLNVDHARMHREVMQDVAALEEFARRVWAHLESSAAGS